MRHLVRFLIAHPGIHRAWHRVATIGQSEKELPDGSVQFPTCAIDRIVWADLMRDAAFVEGIEQGRRDLEAGRSTRFIYRDGRLVNENTGEPLV